MHGPMNIKDTINLLHCSGCISALFTSTLIQQTEQSHTSTSVNTSKSQKFERPHNYCHRSDR